MSKSINCQSTNWMLRDVSCHFDNCHLSFFDSCQFLLNFTSNVWGVKLDKCQKSDVKWRRQVSFLFSIKNEPVLTQRINNHLFRKYYKYLFFHINTCKKRSIFIFVFLIIECKFLSINFLYFFFSRYSFKF